MGKILGQLSHAYERNEAGTHTWRRIFAEASSEDLREFHEEIGDGEIRDGIFRHAQAANFSIPDAPHATDESETSSDSETNTGTQTDGESDETVLSEQGKPGFLASIFGA